MTEEVRKCVEILRYCDESGGCCGGCPSGKTNGIPNCYSISHIANIIESLSAQLDQVTMERDAAMEDLSAHRPCDACGYEPQEDTCVRCRSYTERPYWKWRGAEVEG